MPFEAATAPLIGRAAAEILVRRGARAVTCGRFLAEATALAARLPASSHVLNLCADRYLALLGFAAALLRGQVTLLSSDRSGHRLRELAEAFPDAYALIDPDAACLDAPLPLLRAEVPESAADAANPAVPLDRVVAIGFTSGSTGAPVAHAKNWGALVACAGAAAERFGFTDPADPASLVGTVPPQHMYGFETTMVLPLQAAVAVHAGPAFYPVEIAEALHQAPGRRILVTTPLHLRAVAAYDGKLPPVEAVISATAPMSDELASSAEAALATRVLEIYGATEVGSIASRRTLDGPDWLPYRGIGLRQGEGDTTLVAVPGLPAEVPLADAVELAADGSFRLLGRRSDVVKLGGKRASLAGLNRILAEIEGVEDGVFVVPADIARNPAARLSAYVVAPGRTAAEIVAALRGRVEAVFLPRPVVLVPRLPRDAVGKLSQRALAAMSEAPEP